MTVSTKSAPMVGGRQTPLSLLALEFRRFFPNATFRVLAGLYVLFFLGIYGLALLIGENFQLEMNGTMVKPAQELFEHPKNWQLLAWLGSWFNVTFLGFLGVFLITVEFQNRTLRQGIIFGLTRMETAVSKAAFLIFLGMAATVVYLVLGLFGGVVTSTFSLPPLVSVIGFFLQGLGYLALGTFAGLLIRQTALALLVYLAYVIFLETIARWIFTLMVEPMRVFLFLPDKVLESLAPFPLPRAISAAAEAATASLPSELSSGEAIIATLVYLALLAWFLTFRLQKADL